MTKFTKFPKLSLPQLLKKYRLAQDGVAAIEFVFVAPVMIGMYFGLAEISSAISQDRKISHSTNVAGDLATQVDSITANEMAEIMTATTMVMGVPSTKLSAVKMEIASFSRDSGGAVIPLGKASLNGAFPEAFDANSLDDLILSESSGVVVARVSYDYEPLKLRYMDTNFKMSETFLLKPRKSDNVNFDDGNGEITDFTCSFSGNVATCS